LIEVGLLVAEPATLDRSARCVSLGKKPDQKLATAQILKRDRVPLMRLQAEIRSDISGLDRHRQFPLADIRPRSTSSDRWPRQLI
jgi:hypothetical protein